MVHGDRTHPGEPFVIRIHAEAGFIGMPHIHPSWALGMAHFALSKTDTIIQCTEKTQYRVQKADGNRVWGQSGELEIRK